MAQGAGPCPADPLSLLPTGTQSPGGSPSSHHGDEAADEAEVGEVVGVDGGGRVDLQAVVVLARILEEAVHGVEHLVGQQEEPLPGMRQGEHGDKQLGERTVCVPAPSGCSAGAGHWCDWVRVLPSPGCCVGFVKCFWRHQPASGPAQSIRNLSKCHTQSQLGCPTHTQPQCTHTRCPGSPTPGLAQHHPGLAALAVQADRNPQTWRQPRHPVRGSTLW